MAEDEASNTMNDGIEGNDFEASESNDESRPPMPKAMPRGETKRRAQKVHPRLLLVGHTGPVIDYDDEDYAPPFVAYVDGDVLVNEKRNEMLGIFEPRPPGKAGDCGGRMVVTLVTRTLEPDLVLFVVGIGPTPGKVENALQDQGHDRAA